MKYWLHPFPIGCALVFVCTILFGVFVWVPMLDEQAATERNHQNCTRVLECLDLGAPREQCDALFPNCDTQGTDP